MKSRYHDYTQREDCYFCGSDESLEEHHIIPQRFDGPDTRENTVVVCENCHEKLETLYDSDFYNHFGIDDPDGIKGFQRSCLISDCNNEAMIKLQTAFSRDTVFVCGDHINEIIKSYAKVVNDKTIGSNRFETYKQAYDHFVLKDARREPEMPEE